MQDGDLAYAYAAYKQGAFPGMPEGLRPRGFDLKFYEAAAFVEEIYTLTARHDGGRRPVGLILARIAEEPDMAPRIEPHLLWFPWATPRNKLETSVKWLAEMRLKYLVLIMTPLKDKIFFTHLCRHGVLRVIGKIHFLFGEDDDGMAYQSTRPK